MGAIAGFARLDLIITNGTVSTANPILIGIQDLIQGLGQMIFLPLFLLVEIKLFHALKNSR